MHSTQEIKGKIKIPQFHEWRWWTKRRLLWLSLIPLHPLFLVFECDARAQEQGIPRGDKHRMPKDGEGIHGSVRRIIYQLLFWPTWWCRRAVSHLLPREFHGTLCVWQIVKHSIELDLDHPEFWSEWVHKTRNSHPHEPRKGSLARLPIAGIPDNASRGSADGEMTGFGAVFMRCVYTNGEYNTQSMAVFLNY